MNNDVLEMGHMPEPKREVTTRKPRQAAVAVAPPVAPTTPMDLLRIVTERGASVEEIGKFMDLMERQQANEARQAFVRAMANFKKNPPDIYKDKSVGYTDSKDNFVGYSHATLGNICEVVIGALAEHGISHAWTVEQPPSGLITVTCTLTHDMGHSAATSISAPADSSGKKNPIQSIGSAITYCQRYTLLAACGIAVKEAGDDDGRSAGAAPEDKPEAVKHAIDAPTLARALKAIKASEYTYGDLIAYYAMTEQQIAYARKELGMEGAA